MSRPLRNNVRVRNVGWDIGDGIGRDRCAGNGAWATFAITITAATRWLEFETSGGQHQQQHILITPGRVTSIAAGVRPSGFIPFDDGFMTTGAPINTEMINRVANNVGLIYTDRKWCLWSWLQTDDNTFRLSPATSGGSNYRPLGVAAVTMPDHIYSRTVTATAKATDVGTPDGHIIVGQVGGDSVKLTSNGADNSGTFTLIGNKVNIYATAYCEGAVDVSYVVVSATPGLADQGTAQEIVKGVAPPAAIEYLHALESITHKVYWGRYPVPGLNFSPSLYPGALTQFSVRLGPGTKRLQCAVTRYIIPAKDATTNLDHAKFWNTDSGAGAHEAIRVENVSAGDIEAWPPAGADDEQKGFSGLVQWGSMGTTAAPSAVVFPLGMDRMAEIVEADIAQVELFYDVGTCFGFGGLPIPSDDITSL